MAGKRKGMTEPWQWAAQLRQAWGRQEPVCTSNSLKQQNPDIQQMEGSGLGFTQKETTSRTPLTKATGTEAHSPSPPILPTARAPRELWNRNRKGSPHCDLQVTSA